MTLEAMAFCHVVRYCYASAYTLQNRNQQSGIHSVQNHLHVTLFDLGAHQLDDGDIHFVPHQQSGFENIRFRMAVKLGNRPIIDICSCNWI